jgi:kynureninase
MLTKELDLNTEVPLSARGGFLAVHTTDGAILQKALRKENIWTDYRGETLRLGPAPYVGKAQITEAERVLSLMLRG